VGLGAAAFLSMGLLVLVWVLIRRDSRTDARLVALPPSPLSGAALPELPALAHGMAAIPAVPPMRMRQTSVPKTVTLPAPGSAAIRVAGATDVPYKLVVRALAPAGQFAILAYSAGELNTPGPGVPAGNTIVVPVGSEMEIRLMPRQAIYGRGNTAGVLISTLASESLEV
jgi:hypothetical protein